MLVWKRINCVLFLVLAGATCACTASGPSEPRKITIEDALEIKDTGAPAWLPGGREVSFSWSRGGESELWAADAAATERGQPGAPTLRQLAPLSDRSVPTISPDGKYLAYVSKDHIWKIPLEGGRPVRLTTEEGSYPSRGMVLNWSPDGKHIAFFVQREDSLARPGSPAGFGYQTDVGIVAASGGEPKMIASTTRDEDSPIWTPASDRLVFLRRFEDWKGYEMWITNLDGSEQRRLVTETYERGVEEFRFDGNHHFSPDGKRIVYLSSRTGYNHLWVAPVAGGDPVEITTGPYVDYHPRWSPTEDRIVFIGSRAGDVEERHVWVVDADGGEPVRVSPDGFCTNPAWSPDGSRVAYRRSSTTEPPEIVVQEATPGSPVFRLTESRPDPVVTAGFVEPEAVRYPSRDGTEVPAILLRPRGNERSGPGLLFFHGKGGINLKGWGGLRYYAFHQYLVQQGYSVLFINWRGTHIGYGADFERANYRDYAGGELDDVVAGAEFLDKEVGVDPTRIACWGSSYGGYMTMLAITKAPEVCSAGISRVGVSDWELMLEQPDRKLYNVRVLAKLGDPAENPEIWQRAAPIRYAAEARSPLLILQGQDDPGVVPEQGETLYDAMIKEGKTVEYVAYIGEGHGFTHTGSLRDQYNRMVAFLTEHNGVHTDSTD